MNNDAVKFGPSDVFDAALVAYVAMVQARVNTYFERFKYLTPLTVGVDPGGVKWVRVVVQDTPGAHRSVHSFVERVTGDIRFPASWEAPVRTPSGVRGNIYQDAGVGALAPAPSYHVRYLR